MTYTGTEIGIELDSDVLHHHSDELFLAKIANVKSHWKPVYDEELNAFIGYMESSGGVTKTYDLEGKFVGIDEIPIEPSYIIEDIILLFVGFTEIKLLFQGGKQVVVTAGRNVGRAAAVGVSATILSRSLITGLRVAFRTLTKREIFLFTGTTASRMANSSRYVPTHILYLAVKYGKKMADPQGAAGALKFVINLEKYDKNGNAKTYVLEVVIRMKDWTVLHFLFK
jgi:hypothetical protein